MYCVFAWLLQVGGGGVLGQLSINSMALPPILKFGSSYLRQKVCRAVITGEKCISLAISEPWAGSDVAGLRTKATFHAPKSASEEGYFVINGSKKWITGGLMADFFTCAVRTDGKGARGLSLLLLEKDMPGTHCGPGGLDCFAFLSVTDRCDCTLCG